MFTVIEHISWLGSAVRSQFVCEPTGIMGAGEPKVQTELDYRPDNKFSQSKEGLGGGII